MQKPQRHFTPKVILLMKIFSAVLLLFSCFLFLFLNLDTFKRDLGFDAAAPLGSDNNGWGNLLFPILFIFGLCFIIYYMGNMIIRYEMKQIWKADRMFVTYQIVFNGMFIITTWRWFFINFSYVLIPSIIMLVACFVNLITPRIVDNDNQDF